MNLMQSFKLALKGLATSKMRAFLTMLGIIIGVGAVIVIMSLGNGMQKQLLDSFESMGANTLQVSLYGRGSTRGISDEDMYDFYAENTEYFDGMSPMVQVRGMIKEGNTSYTSTITGVGEDYADIKTWEMSSGRFLQYIDIARRQKVCVIGAYLDNEIFGGDSLGKTLKINGEVYQVVGVVEELYDKTSEYGSDNMVLIPYTNAMILAWNGMVSDYIFTSASDDTVDEAKSLIEARLVEAYGNDSAFYVMSMAEVMNELTTVSNTMITVLACIAGISLLVGGIGIMNIMLVSVTERTREIGIRKALGAKRKDIRGQFVIEAGTTSALGGTIGIILGVVLAGVAGNAFGISAIPTAQSILLAFGVSVGIGVLFGFLPANKAAKLNPIDALRYD